MEAKKLIDLFDREGYLRGTIVPGYVILGTHSVSIEKGEIDPEKYYYTCPTKPKRIADVDLCYSTWDGRKKYLFSID